MDWSTILNQVLYVVITTAVGALCTFLISLIRKKSAAIQNSTKDETLANIIAQTEQIVTSCIQATNQTYVESLKNQKIFDAAAQKEAFNKTFEAAKSMLSKEAQQLIAENYGDVAKYLTTLIESKIKDNK